MHAVTYQRRLDDQPTERSTRHYATAPEARQAARRAIERARPGATMQARIRGAAGDPWTPITDGDRRWRDAYHTWPAHITYQLTRTIRLTGDQPAVEVTRVTVEPE